MLDDDATVKKFRELKKSFHEEARKMYPRVEYPDLAWLFDQVLDIDVTHVAAVPISKKEYTVFVLDADGQRSRDKHGELVSVKRKFTGRQRQHVREWWPLLSWDMTVD